ncbi:DUF1120 domain-containing protein [Serratia symbiotica]|uniref:DUF1120 domain-containing protein n=1 Tax=Serratia symbiotica TaxID=138074 RepID=A0A068Z4T5_9GAMM|nr:DUF1120 domain-containing protein [Serratia symbiotica]QLH62434.1 DUF1120 domain-containing protein [Serratia symbiotica]CDS58499.1 putative transcriptional regulator (YhcF) [Serratia symbiotica]
MKKVTTLTLLCAFSVSGANAANEINVKGKIVPPACTVNFAKGSDDLDWGNIPHNSLSATQFTILPKKEASLTVTCDGETAMSFTVSDPYKATAIAGMRVGSGYANGDDANRIFGLGLDPVSKQKIGNFTLIGTGSSYDDIRNDKSFGVKSATDISTQGFTTHLFSEHWGIPVTEKWTILKKDINIGEAAKGKVLTFDFDVVPQLNIISKITATEEVNFKGTAQFTVSYF